MARLDAKASTYPWVKQWFNMHFTSIPRTNPAAFNAFAYYTVLKDSSAKAAFTLDTNPTFTIGKEKGFYAYCPPSGDTLELGKTYLDEMNAVLGVNRYPASPATTHGPYSVTELMFKCFLILEANVLHEMVHYYRRKTDGEAAIRYRSAKGRGIEERYAIEWEHKAYGHTRPSVRSLGLSSRFPRTALEVGW